MVHAYRFIVLSPMFLDDKRTRSKSSNQDKREGTLWRKFWGDDSPLFLSYTSKQFPFLTFNFVWGRRSVNTALQQVSKMDEGYDLLKIIFTTQHLLFFLRFRLFGRIKIYKCTYSLSVHLAKNAILHRFLKNRFFPKG